MKINSVNTEKLLIANALGFILMAAVPTLIRDKFTVGLLSAEELLAIILPFYWLPTLMLLARQVPKMKDDHFYTVFVTGVLMIMLAQGIHLVSNQFNDHLFHGEVLSEVTQDTAYLYDEVLSHYLFIFGYFGMLSVLVYADFLSNKKVRPLQKLVIPFAVGNGILLSIFSLEGQVVAVSFPFVITYILVMIWLKYIKRYECSKHYNLMFFFVVMITTFVLLSIWGIYYGGFPELTEVGLL